MEDRSAREPAVQRADAAQAMGVTGVEGTQVPLPGDVTELPPVVLEEPIEPIERTMGPAGDGCTTGATVTLGTAGDEWASTTHEIPLAPARGPITEFQRKFELYAHISLHFTLHAATIC